MKNISLSRSSFDFLKDLSKNNNREWFNKNKERYIREYENMIAFAAALLQEMKKHDTIETTSGKDALFRIYRDTRFSKDKTPHKTCWAGTCDRETASRVNIRQTLLPMLFFSRSWRRLAG